MSRNLWGRIVARLLSGPGMSRARTFVTRFSRFVDVDETLLDLGCGTGQVGLFSRLYRRQNVTLADVRPPWWYIGQWLFGVPCAKALAQKYAMRYVMCDGVRLPFADGEFDTLLLLSVLHHAKSPEAVLAEAARVSRKRVIVFEDIPRTRCEALVCWVADVLINLEVPLPGRSHGNRSQVAWEKAFGSVGLRVTHVESFHIPLFPITMFVLGK